jgi:hypothetical protein
MGQPRWTPRSRPRTPGHKHSEGRINLQSFSPLHSEGYILSPASQLILLAGPLFFRDLLFCLRNFHVRCSRPHPHFWERTASVCIKESNNIRNTCKHGMDTRDEHANRQCLQCGDTERKKHEGPGESAKTDARTRGRLPHGTATLPAPRHHCQAASQTPPRQHLRATTPLRTRRTEGAGPPRRLAPALPARAGGVRVRRCQCPPASSPWWRCWS